MEIKIHISTHAKNGKLKDLNSINSYTMHNKYCKAQYTCKRKICHSCYNVYLLHTVRGNMVKWLKYNDDLLSHRIIDTIEIPYLNYHIIRYNSYGELLNKVHFINYCNIARRNKHCHFTLYTKRIDIVRKCKDYIPSNMLLIYSSPIVNKQSNIPDLFHKVYTVYTDEYFQNNIDTDINCIGKCCDCLKCYNSKDKTIYVNELVKNYTSKAMEKVIPRVRWYI